MKEEKISIKHEYPKKSPWYEPHAYIIYKGKTAIGYIRFKIVRRILVIGYLNINENYRNNHYGYMVMEYLLSHYKIKCIVGQSLKESRSFWNKIIKRYCGQRRNYCTLDNCSSSFIIPKYKITACELERLLNIGHDIE